MDELTLSIEEKINDVMKKIDNIHNRLDIFENKINKLNYLICDSPKNIKVEVETEINNFEVISNQNIKKNETPEKNNTKKEKKVRTLKKSNFDYDKNQQITIYNENIMNILDINTQKISRFDLKSALLKYLNNNLVLNQTQIEKLKLTDIFVKLNLQKDVTLNYYQFEVNFLLIYRPIFLDSNYQKVTHQ